MVVFSDFCPFEHVNFLCDHCIISLGYSFLPRSNLKVFKFFKIEFHHLA